jgi:hypothetical protein
MRKKTFRRTGRLTGTVLLLSTVILYLNSCDLSGEPGFGKGTLTLLLPETGVREEAGASRSVLSDNFTGTLVYRLTITGPGEPQTLESGGGGTTLSLNAGEWTIEAAAYDPGNPAKLAGSGRAVIAVIAGQNSSVRIPMRVDPAYEAGLTEIYIHNEAELRRIGTDFAIDGSFITHFYLENDIVLTQPWTPIGSPGVSPAPDEPFKAVFDGQGHTITVRSFSGSKKSDNFVYQGFFALVENAAIKDTAIKYELPNPVLDISTGDGGTYYDGYAGGVAGNAIDTTFTNIQVTGNFSVIFDGTSGLRVGGIAGQADDVSITGCRVSGTIGGTSANYLAIGGIAGMISNSLGGGDISGSSFTGTITGNGPGNAEAGGIAGFAEDIEIIECFAEGRIAALSGGSQADAGGIVGHANNYYAFKINESYAAGVIESATTGSYSNAGGIIAGFSGPTTIENCYAWANVSSSSTYGETAGGIAGTNDGAISKCYAAGTVQSKGSVPYTVVGGIAGDGSGTISSCMALVSELVGGPSTSTSKTVNAIFASSYGTLSNNYALEVSSTQVTDKMWIHNNTNTSDQGLSTARDGAIKNLADFKDQTTSNIYTTAGWTFPGVWKFISGYDYPVLHWQERPPADPATLP